MSPLPRVLHTDPVFAGARLAEKKESKDEGRNQLPQLRKISVANTEIVTELPSAKSTGTKCDLRAGKIYMFYTLDPKLKDSPVTAGLLQSLFLGS